MIASQLRALCVLAAFTMARAQAQAQAQPPVPPPADAVQHGMGPAAFGIISTHAVAHRRLPNTVSDVSVSIEAHGRDVPDTTASLAKRSQALLDYLRGQDTGRLMTEQVSFEPETQELRGQPDRIKGYTGRATISFRTTPDRLPALLAGCLDNGATGLVQSGASPREDEIEVARLDLAAEATRLAMTQAVAIAGAADQRITGIQQIDMDPMMGGPGFPMQVEAMARRASRPAAAISAEAGETRIAVTVLLKVRIAPLR